MIASTLEAYCIKTEECPTLQKSPHTFLQEALAIGMVQTSQKMFRQNQIKKRKEICLQATLKILNYGICLTRPARRAML